MSIYIILYFLQFFNNVFEISVTNLLMIKLGFIEQLQRKRGVTFSRKSNQKAFFTWLRGKTLRKLCQQVDTDDFSRHFNRRLEKS